MPQNCLDLSREGGGAPKTFLVKRPSCYRDRDATARLQDIVSNSHNSKTICINIQFPLFVWRLPAPPLKLLFGAKGNRKTNHLLFKVPSGWQIQIGELERIKRGAAILATSTPLFGTILRGFSFLKLSSGAHSWLPSTTNINSGMRLNAYYPIHNTRVYNCVNYPTFHIDNRLSLQREDTIDMASNTPKPSELATIEGLLTEYDFVIIGGGTAGLVIATRLTEDPELRVLVVEAAQIELPIHLS